MVYMLELCAVNRGAEGSDENIWNRQSVGCSCLCCCWSFSPLAPAAEKPKVIENKEFLCSEVIPSFFGGLSSSGLKAKPSVKKKNRKTACTFAVALLIFDYLFFTFLILRGERHCCSFSLFKLIFQLCSIESTHSVTPELKHVCVGCIPKIIHSA